MSDDGSEKSAGPTQEEVARNIEDKCYKAFIKYDYEGSGGEIKVDDVHDVLKEMEVNMKDDEVYMIISEIDPQNSGYL